MSNLKIVSRQWATRPDDERFVTLKDLHAMTSGQKKASKEGKKLLNAMAFEPMADDGLLLVAKDTGTKTAMTNHAFRQLSAIVGAPAGYLSSLPAPIAASALNHGLAAMSPDDERSMLLTNLADTGKPVWQTRAVLGTGYGRVWNADITAALVKMFPDGSDWKVPGEFGKAVTVTKANTTIYGSEVDIFVFLCDETNRIEIKNRRNGKSGSLARGFIVFNSEVGTQTLGVMSFLFDYACSNRTIWGVEGFRSIKIKHTSGAPLRWMEELTPILADYHNTKASGTEKILALAQAAKFDGTEGAIKTLTSIGFNPKQAGLIMGAHMAEEDRPIETMWDASVGITAWAKTIAWNDERVKVEAKAGKILDMVANAA